MTTTLTSRILTFALSAVMLAGAGHETFAQKSTQKLWQGKHASQSGTFAGSHTKVNALVSRPGNSQDFIATGGGNWQHYTNSAYTYDSQGRLTQRIYTNPNTTQNIGREVITYDVKGNESEYRAEAWNGTAWDLVDGYRTNTTYNSKGNKTEVIYEYWDGSSSVWLKDSREETVYDANDLVTSITYSSWQGSFWENTDRMLLTNTGGVGTSALMQEFNSGVWEDTYRALNLTWHVLYEIPSAYELEYFNGIGWVKEEKYSSVYDANGGHVGIYQTWSGTAWENSSRETETYDNNKNYTGWKEESWNTSTSSWDYEGEDRQVLTYSGIDITERIFQNSWGSPTATLEDNNKEVYSNFQTFNISGVKNLLADANINVFPNPATDMLRIESTALKGDISATLSDITGKTWLIKTFKTDEITQLNIETLPKGIYLLQLQTESGNAIKRIVKQ